MLKITFLTALLVLGSCASKPPKKSPQVAGGAGRPTWLNNVGEACKKSQLCAVGMGESRALAEAHATSNIAKMFDVQVSSTFTSQEINEGEDSLLSSFEQIKEETSMELEGVTHPQNYEDDKYYYSLAKVRKMPLAMRFKKEMDRLGDEMEALKKEESTGVVLQLQDLLVKWRLAHARHRFLTGLHQQEPLSFKELMALKKRLTRGMVVDLSIETPSAMKEVSSYLGGLLTDSGLSLSERGATHLLLGTLKEKNEFIKVDGFKKYSYLLTLDAQNKQGVKSSSLSLSTIQTGRSRKQARLKAIDELKKQLKDNIYKVSFKKQE